MALLRKSLAFKQFNPRGLEEAVVEEHSVKDS